MKRTAQAKWLGSIKEGQGHLTTASGVLNETQYSFTSRFESGIGTNPEELLAAAHAGCFTMALSGQLGKAQLTAESIETTAALEFSKDGDGFRIQSVHLEVTARVPQSSKEAFEKAAKTAKEDCPVSKLFKAEITMTAHLVE